MKIVINLLLLGLVVFLGFFLYKSIEEPISFKGQLTQRENAVVDKLIKVREAQKWYWEVTGEYANSWQQLKDTLTHGQIKIEKIIGDPDDPNFTGEVTRELVLRPVNDTITKLGINLEDIDKVPFSNGKQFDVKADTTTYKETKINVVEVGTQYKTFMGDYADVRFSKYESSYDPNKTLKFGDLTSPSLSGSWDRSK